MLYLMLLDRDVAGDDWRACAFDLFEINPDAEPEVVERMHRTHPERARWMTKIGYHLLVKERQKEQR